MGADDLIRLRATTRKGSSHRHLVATEFRIPVVAQPLLAAGLRYFSAQLPDDREFFWELPGDPPPASWTAETQTGWLHSALAASGQPLPDNVAWTSHSLRYGSASAAYAAGVDLPRIFGTSGGLVTLQSGHGDYVPGSFYPPKPGGYHPLPVDEFRAAGGVFLGGAQ